MTLYWHPTGPRLSFKDRTFTIEDLNPEVRIDWAIGRWQLCKIGINCIIAAMRERGAPRAENNLSRAAD
jgi:hypothetical protein